MAQGTLTNILTRVTRPPQLGRLTMKGRVPTSPLLIGLNATNGKVSRHGKWRVRSKGTRLLAAAIFENFEAGSPIEETMEQFRVRRERIKALLEFAVSSLLAPVHSSTGTDAHAA